MPSRRRSHVPAAPLSLALFLLCSLLDAASVLDVYRLVQVDMEGLKLGSPYARFSSFATLPVGSAKTFRAVVVLPVSLSSVELVSELLQKNSGIEALLLVLPRDFDKGALSADEHSKLLQIEEALARTKVLYPVFFAVDSDALASLVSDVQATIERGHPPASTTDRYVLEVPGLAPRKAPMGKLVNFVGWLSAEEGKGIGKSSADTILVTASYDAFTLAPGLPGGSSSSGSGVAVLLQLLRFFHGLYASADTRGNYNLLFVLTSGAPYSFEGLRQWLDAADGAFLESVQFALCLDGLAAPAGGQAGLHLHYSKPPKEPEVAKWYRAFTAAAADASVVLAEVHKKVNISALTVGWQHEHFSKRKMHAATLSARAEPPPEQLLSSSLSDQWRPEVGPQLATAAALVQEGLLRLIYTHSQLPAALSRPVPSSSVVTFVSQWHEAVSRTPRVLPFLATGTVLLDSFAAFFRQHANTFTRHTWSFARDPAFYAPVAATMTVSRSSSLFFDLVLLLAVIVYLCSLFAVLRICTRGWDDFVAMFQAAPTKYKRY